MIARKAEQLHRLVLEAPVWTYVVCGRVRRTWGYQTERGWVPWRQHALGEFAPCEPAEPAGRWLAGVIKLAARAVTFAAVTGSA